jgi:hypothetical protein
MRKLKPSFVMDSRDCARPLANKPYKGEDDNTVIQLPQFRHRHFIRKSEIKLF